MFAAACAVLQPGAVAQEPTFTFTRSDPVEQHVWRSSVQLGVSAKAGNTRSIGAGLVARGPRRTGPARISGDVSGAYARSQIEIATDTNGVPGIGASEIRKVSQTSSEAWELRLRLDRYLGDTTAELVFLYTFP